LVAIATRRRGILHDGAAFWDCVRSTCRQNALLLWSVFMRPEPEPTVLPPVTVEPPPLVSQLVDDLVTAPHAPTSGRAGLLAA
jgi:hypothetical protein